MPDSLPGANSRLMMRLLRDGGDQSRTSLSEMTGMSATTVSKAVADLVARGWVVESGAMRAAVVGRPAIKVRRVPEATVVCGIQLGVGVARVCLADGCARILRLREYRWEPDASPDAVLTTIGRAARRMIRQGKETCLGVGVGVPGPVDVEQRINLLSINLGWQHVPVADQLEKAIGLPVVVDHNVRAMALAESRYGRRQLPSMAYIYVKTGVGMGVVLHGRPFVSGVHGVSEIGHIQVDRAGGPCSCGGTGCLETVVSEPALIRSLALAGLEVPAAESESVLTILEKYRTSLAIDAIRDSLVGTLSSSLGVVMNLMNPGVIVLGGIFETAPDRLIADIAAGTAAVTFPLLRHEVRLARPSLQDAGVAGAAALALERWVYG